MKLNLIIIFCLVGIALGIEPLVGPGTDTVQFNRTNKNVLPNGLNQVHNSLGATNLAVDTQILVGRTNGITNGSITLGTTNFVLLVKLSVDGSGNLVLTDGTNTMLMIAKTSGWSGTGTNVLRDNGTVGSNPSDLWTNSTSETGSIRPIGVQNIKGLGTLHITGQITNDSLTAASLPYITSAKVLGSLGLGNSGDLLRSAGAGVTPSFQPIMNSSAGYFPIKGTNRLYDSHMYEDQSSFFSHGLINIQPDWGTLHTGQAALWIEPYGDTNRNGFFGLYVENDVDVSTNSYWPAHIGLSGSIGIYGLSVPSKTNTTAVGIFGAVDPAQYYYSVGVLGEIEEGNLHTLDFSTNIAVAGSVLRDITQINTKSVALYGEVENTNHDPVIENAVLLLDNMDSGVPLIIARKQNGGTTLATLDNSALFTLNGIFGGFLAQGTAFGSNTFANVWPEGVSVYDDGAVRMFLRPNQPDGTVPYSFKSSVSHAQTNLFEVRNFTTNRFGVIANPPATTTSLYLWDADTGSMQAVTVGAADSGGVGFKLLRIPN